MTKMLISFGREFSRVSLIFWYFLPLFVFAAFCLVLYIFLPIDISKYIPMYLIAGFVSIYFLVGFWVSGLVVYRVLGDKLNFSPLFRALISFVLIFFGGSVISGIFAGFFRGVPAELIGTGFAWIEAAAIQGGGFETVAKSFLVFSGIYVMVAFAWAFIPVCVILLLIGRR